MIEARIQHRFSSKRLEAVVLSLSDVQKGYITKHGFGHLLDVHHFHVPLPFLEWIVEHIIVRSCQFRYQNKTININRSMVGSVLGIPSGDTAVNLEVKDVTVKNKIKELRDNFFGRSKLSISEIIALLYGDEKEESFMMSFMLVALACVICPSTQNNVNLKYINCLMDPYAIRNYDWSGHALDYICIEIQKFQGAIDSHDDSVSFKPLYVGGCLPLLAIIYMDFLNIESLVNHHEISYSIPRLCNVKSSDFSFVIDIDCNKSIQRRFSFGVTSFREISATPYAPTQNESENSNSQQPFRDFSDNAIPSPFHVSYEDDPNFRAIVSKYKDLFREQVVSSVFPAVLGSILPIFSDQMALMSAEIYSYCLSLRHNTTSHAQNVNSTPNNNSSGLNVDGSFLEQNFSSLPNVHMNTISSTPMASQDIQRHNIHEVDNHGCAEFHVTIHRSFQGTPIHQHSNTSDATPLINTSMVSPSLSNIAPISPFGTGHTETINPHKQRIGSSTLKKRNRKRRQAIYPQEDLSVKITISDTVEKVYDVFVREEIHPAQHEINSPLFINICGFHCSYLRFRQSLKAKGQVYDDVMGLFVQLFNLEYLDIPESRFSRKKIAFSPFLVSKLHVVSNSFDHESIEGELTRINGELDMVTTHLFFFPLIIGDYWVLICVNTLFKQINFFNTSDTMNIAMRDNFINTVVTNFQRACKAAHIFDKDFERYEHVYPACPKSNLRSNDSGIFSMLFMENFDGKVLKTIDHSVATQYRKLVAFKAITCPLNEVDPDKFDQPAQEEED